MLSTKETQNKNKHFFDKATSFYEFPFVKLINRYIQGRDLNQIEIRPNSQILDAGCGTGTFLNLIKSRYPDTKLHGIDVSKKMVSISKSRLKGKASIKLQSVEDLKSPEFRNRYNYIFNIDSFHHYADQEKAMKNFYRALKKDGTLVIADFSFGHVGNWLFKNLEPANSRMLLKKEFHELFRKHGFKNIKEKRLGIFSLMTIGEK